MSAVRTACPYCGVGCGIRADVSDARPESRAVHIAGDRAHPANRGRLCSKGTHLGETVSLTGRLLQPMIGERQVDWDEAAQAVADGLRETIAAHGRESVAFYVSGQVLTEDYYVANKLMKGFIGTANIDTNSRLCMASAVVAHNRAFGEDVVPCRYTDLEEADLILLVGSNTAWCHPVVWQRIEAARAERGTRLVVIDPRRTETAEQADLHIPVAPDGDIALFGALARAMAARGLIDHAYLAAHVTMPTDYLDALQGLDVHGGIDPALFAKLATLVADHPRMVTLFSQGVNQSASGSDKGNAIINLHLLTGRIGKPGAGPFSITGQPNAMGGREVGGLASMLACHMSFSDAERAAAQGFWRSPTIAPGPGLKAVDLFRAAQDGRIKAIWIMATNPAVSMPDAGFVRAALARCPLVIVSDVVADTDTVRLAHIRLPALAWGEKEGTVTNSERTISRQRALFPPPGAARADWAILSDVAARMGWGEAFAFESAAAVFREYAAMTALSAARGLKLDLTAYAAISDSDYDALAPFRWGGEAPFADGRFSHEDGRARILPIAPPAPRFDSDFPLRLNTGRYRDQWHTMTRTGLSPRLSVHRREPLVEVHGDDAARYRLADGGFALVSTRHGASLYRVAITDAQAPGGLFVPIHWTDTTSSGGRTGLLPCQRVDPHSGQPAFKNVGAAIAPWKPEWRAFLVSQARPETLATPYWARIPLAGGWLHELAGTGAVDIDALLGPGDRIEARDPVRGMLRLVVLDEEGRLDRALFVTRTGTLPPRDWIAGQLGKTGETTASLLAGRAGRAGEDAGAIVCVCRNVGTRAIERAMREGDCASVPAIGAATGAGTQCGSCRPLLSRMLADFNRTKCKELVR